MLFRSAGYFNSPVAYVFLVIFLLMTAAFTFLIGQFMDRNQATLQPFFMWHPWIYLFLVPAVGMRLWSEERRQGTMELLLTLPISLWHCIIGKFLASWLFLTLALVMTFPIWITVNYLGDPDNSVIIASYIGSFVMAGAYLAIGSCISALTKNQVIAFIVAAAVCFIFTMSGLELVLNFFRLWAPDLLVDTVSSMSFLTHFRAITKGVIDIRDFIFFGSLIAVFLFANVVAVDAKKGA